MGLFDEEDFQIKSRATGEAGLIHAAKSWKQKSAMSMYPQDEKMEYNINSVPIGATIKKDGSYGKILKLNMSKSKQTLMVGKTGDGKTVLMQRLFSVSQQCGVHNFIPADLKSEMSYQKQPLQKKYHQYLWHNKKGDLIEKPEGIESMKIYHPVYLTQFTSKKPPNSIPCQFSISDITKEDLITMLNFQKWTDNQRALLDNVWDKYQNGDINSFTQMMEAFDKDEEIKTRGAVSSLKGGIKRLLTSRVIGDQFDTPTMVDDLIRDQVPVLDTAGFMNASVYSDIATAIVGINLRKVMEAKMSGLIPKGWHVTGYFPEGEKIIPADGNPSSKKEIIKLYKTMRNYKMDGIIDCQTYGAIAPEVLDQCDRVWIGKNVKLDDKWELLKQYMPDVYSSYVDIHGLNRSKAIFASDLRGMQGKNCWLLLDKDFNDFIIVKPFMPLGGHMSE